MHYPVIFLDNNLEYTSEHGAMNLGCQGGTKAIGCTMDPCGDCGEGAFRFDQVKRSSLSSLRTEIAFDGL